MSHLQEYLSLPLLLINIMKYTYLPYTRYTTKINISLHFMIDVSTIVRIIVQYRTAE